MGLGKPKRIMASCCTALIQPACRQSYKAKPNKFSVIWLWNISKTVIRIENVTDKGTRLSLWLNGQYDSKTYRFVCRLQTRQPVKLSSESRFLAVNDPLKPTIWQFVSESIDNDIDSRIVPKFNANWSMRNGISEALNPDKQVRFFLGHVGRP